MVSKLGRLIINFVREIGQITMLLINIIKYIPRIAKDRIIVLQQMSIVGSDSLPLVLLIGSFTGAIAALQATNLFDKFNLIGIATPFLGSSIATVVFTELSPVLTAIVIAGRVGGGMAAQLGTMKVTEQIDALITLSANPIQYLTVPRFLAGMVSLPLLTLLADFVGIIDFDNKDKSEYKNNRIYTLGGKNRHSLENYILDPLYVSLYILIENYPQKNILGFQTKVYQIYTHLMRD